MKLSEWASSQAPKVRDSLAGVDRALLLYPPTPDGIASNVIVGEIISQLGVDVREQPITPELMIEVIPYNIDVVDSVVFVDTLPNGPGLLKLAINEFRSVIVFDHGGLPYEIPPVVRINPFEPGVSTSLISYLISVALNGENEILSWISVAGFYGECSSPVCEEVKKEAQLFWPDLTDDQISLLQDSLIAASYLGEDWIQIASAALQESYDDPSWFLTGNSATSSVIKSRIEEVKSKIKETLSERPLSFSGLLAWEVDEPFRRDVISLITHSELGIPTAAFHVNDPLGLVSIRFDHRIDPLNDIRSALSGVEHSFYGGWGFLSMIVDSAHLEFALNTVSKILRESSGGSIR